MEEPKTFPILFSELPKADLPLSGKELVHIAQEDSSEKTRFAFVELEELNKQVKELAQAAYNYAGDVDVIASQAKSLATDANNTAINAYSLASTAQNNAATAYILAKEISDFFESPNYYFSMQSLPVDKHSISVYAIAATAWSWATSPIEGRNYMILLKNTSASDFTQLIPNAGSWDSKNRTSVVVKAGSYVELSAWFMDSTWKVIIREP